MSASKEFRRVAQHASAARYVGASGGAGDLSGLDREKTYLVVGGDTPAIAGVFTGVANCLEARNLLTGVSKSWVLDFYEVKSYAVSPEIRKLADAVAELKSREDHLRKSMNSLQENFDAAHKERLQLEVELEKLSQSS